MLQYMPLRALLSFAGDRLDPAMIAQLIAALNGD